MIVTPVADDDGWVIDDKCRVTIGRGRQNVRELAHKPSISFHAERTVVSPSCELKFPIVVWLTLGFGPWVITFVLHHRCDTGELWVIDSFRGERSSALYHVQRIHSMTKGLRIPIAWPHDGSTHDKGSGLSLASQYKAFGARMMPTHAVNHGTKTNSIEPALAEIREMMFTGKLTIAGHNHELLEELRHYHRDQNYKIVKQRDDLISAFRYAVMMRRHGKPLSEIDGIGYGAMPYAGQRRANSGPQIARGLDFDLF